MKTASITDFSQFASLRSEARAESPGALRKAAQQFEGLLMQQMLKGMRAASVGDDVLGGEQTRFYQEMFDQQIAQHLSAGRGLGIADMLVRQLGGTPETGPGASGIADQGPANGAANRHGIAPGPAIGSLESIGRAAASARPQPPAGAVRPEPGSAAAAATDDVPAATTPRDPVVFVRQLLPHAEKAAAELGIPAKVLVAQAALETGWGRHQIRRDDGSAAHNLFGIKADRRWNGAEVNRMTGEHRDGAMRRERADFRAYASVGAAFDDYVRFLKHNPRYAQALQHGGDPAAFAAGLQKAGYATDPDYASKILRIADGRTMRGALAALDSAPAPSPGGAPAPRRLTV